MKFFRSVGQVFGYSPFPTLVKHAILCGRAVGILQKQFEAYENGKFELVERFKDEIDELESRADELKEEIRTHVTRSLILPIDRQDLLEFLKTQDDIINNCEHVGHMLTFRKIKLDNNITIEFKVLLAKIMECVNEYEAMVEHIKNLIETSFEKKEIQSILEHIQEVENLEHECDQIQIRLHTILFNSESLKPLDVYLMETWVVHLGYIANAVARSADRFKLMILGR
ncbi:MAG: TIGR00153 family protein [Archaeoglobaceae archaeon]|nr:TIGR00153 family protein [Archaeoglobaceae archaeon]MDW8117466.1 TIGR00153 family protein [Archaeoglobaceae archaeon]